MDDDLERQLREALQRESLRVSPRDRLAEIRALTNATPLRPGRPRWLVPVGAAAAAALIAGVVWGAGVLPGSGPPAPAAPSTTTRAATTPPTSPAPTTSPASSPKPSTPATAVRAVPVYYIGSEVPGGRPALFREFVSTVLPAAATDAELAKKAVALALTHTDPDGLGGLTPWGATTVTRVVVTPALITVTLKGTGLAGLGEPVARLAVRQLMWTAQAAVGRGNIPVRFASAAPTSAELFGLFPWDRRYTRPPGDRQYEDLAAIWVEQPSADAVLPVGTPVVVSGSACVFEGTLLFRVEGPTGGVRTITASSGCPTRGAWSVTLRDLAAGDYVVTVSAASPKDGSTVAERSRRFTVQ